MEDSRTQILLLGGSVRFWWECALCFCCCNKMHLEKQLKEEGLIVQVQFNSVNEVKVAACSHIHSQEQCCGLNEKGHIGPYGWHY